MSKTECRSIPTVEAAKLIRKRLKAVFPDVKFSVRKDGYSSVVVRTSVKAGEQPDVWAKIEDELRGFQGQGFDGMIDMSFYKDSWLNPDGSAVIARHPGTVGSRGIYEPVDNPAPDEKSELVHFSCGYVSLSHGWEFDKVAD